MRLKKLISICMTFSLLTGVALAQKRAIVEEILEVSQVPDGIPQRISGMAYDGEKLWLSVYHSGGRYATFDLISGEWVYSGDETHHRAIREITQPFSASSGLAFDGKTLWVGGSYGEALGSIDVETWQVGKVIKGRLRSDLHNSQGYSSLAFDGESLWAAWHMTEYKRPVTESQQLLKIDRISGEVLEIYPLPPGSRPDMTHGLTFDGETLWHIKDCRLSAIGLDGKVLAQYRVKGPIRPSGLAWDSKYLWIVDFGGKLWKLPLI